MNWIWKLMQTAACCGMGKGFLVGYRASVAVSEDHLIVAQRVGQERADNGLLVPLAEAVEQQCRERPQRVLADAGFFSVENLERLSQQGVHLYVPDSHLARELGPQDTGARTRRRTTVGPPPYAAEVAQSSRPPHLSPAPSTQWNRFWEC